MTNVSNRYSTTVFELAMNEFESEESLLDELRRDAPNSTLYGCSIHRYGGGVIFDRINVSENVLDYRILIPTPLTEDPWMLDQEWSDPFGADNDFNKIPGRPPYWSSAFLSLQYAIDSTFIERVSTEVTPRKDVRLRRMPDAAYNVNSIAAFLSIASYVWGLCAFV
ncbi:unnamed protein product, partial [Cylicostephanus goldi]